jgi:hypothetical protein
MPMRKAGGRVKAFKKGGAVKVEAEGDTADADEADGCSGVDIVVRAEVEKAPILKGLVGRYLDM